MSKTGWFVLAAIAIAVLGFEYGSKVVGFGALWVGAAALAVGVVGVNSAS